MVHVIDSENVTVGERALVEYAIRLKDAGDDIDTIVNTINREKKNIHVVGLLDTLEYLKKGGRISKTVAFVGGMLSIKPVISIEAGEVAMLGKARGSKQNFITAATQAMLGLEVDKPSKSAFDLDYVGIKASQFSFSRLQGADPVLGVDMSSTGEVGCLGDDSPEALLKAMMAVGYTIPRHAVLMSSGTIRHKVELLEAARMLSAHGLTIYATEGTRRFLGENGVPAIRAYWPGEEGSPAILDLLHGHEIDMVVNIPKDLTPKELSNGYRVRRAAVDLNIPLLTNARLASAFIRAFCEVPLDTIDIKSWDEY